MQLVSQYKQFVISNISWAKALEQALGNKKFLAEAVVESLAQAHAEAYGEKHNITIHYQQSLTGSWQFYSDEECSRESRHDTATKQWQRTVGKYHKTSAKPRKVVSKQVDKVSKVVELFEALSKSEQAKFLRIVK
jgi:hypothetical protein